jgi:hypothetical protein
MEIWPVIGMTQGATFEEVLVAMGFVAGGLMQSAVFAALVESIQHRGIDPSHVIFLRDTLTRALQLAGVEPIQGTDT